MTVERSKQAPSIHSVETGEEGAERRLVFLHGLFGRGKNFATIAKALQPEFRCLLVDLPNHGKSAWTEEFDYVQMADAVAEHLASGFAQDGPVDVLGHSMGGKVAMILALRHPELVRKLVVEDVAPVDTGAGRSEFDHLLGSLIGLDLDSVTSRSDADAQLADPIPQRGVRGFLLQNLVRADGGYAWEPNLELLHGQLGRIMDFPADRVEGQSFNAPVLWMAGERSHYVKDEDQPVMEQWFPRTLRVTIKGATHWVHSDQPESFTAALRTFLQAD